MNLKEELTKFKNKLFGMEQKKSIPTIAASVVKSELTEQEVKEMRDQMAKFNEGYIKEGYITPIAEAISNHFNSIRKVSLNAKVNDFIYWCFKNMIKDNEEFFKPNDMRNFIEKIAVWYELRYPDYEINRLMPGSNQDLIKINDVMFNDNKYMNDLFGRNINILSLDWGAFYNAEAFFNSLPGSERWLLEEAKYGDIVFIEPYRKGAHLHLTSEGFVNESEGFSSYTKLMVNDDELKGMHIKNVVQLLKEKGISLPNDNELEKMIERVEKWNYQKEEIFNCAMYRIIERGGNRMGPRRAFLFAKEFHRNIDIPMMYGVDFTDPGLRSFINEYIKAGGSKDLVCYVDYFTRARQNQKMDTVTVQEMIKTVYNDCVTKYTEEETELHQRLVNALANKVDSNKVKKLRKK